MSAKLESLRSLADRVHPPPFDALEQVARRRTRQAAVAATLTGTLVVAAAVGGLALVTSGDDRSAPEPISPPTPSPTVTLPPTPTPTPATTHESDTSMTPAEVVAAEDAVLLTAGASLDDPAFRVSLWQAVCHWCPRGEVTPVYRALAITSDSYATTVYRRPPFDAGTERVVSVAPGLLAIVDGANGHEWLVRDDGTITALNREVDAVAAADPRLWVVCLGDPVGVDPDLQDGAPSQFDPQPTWCAVDPKNNTIHIWMGPWIRTLDDSESLVSPGSGESPWGVRFPSYGPGRPAPEVDRAEIWWEADGSRLREDLGPVGAADGTGPVSNGAPGVMSSWVWTQGSPAISVITSTDQGDTWQRMSLRMPFRPKHYWDLDLSWTPDGDLVAHRLGVRNGLEIYRAEAVDGAAFQLVLDTGSVTAYGDPTWAVHGDRIVTSGFSSDDDGRTWSAITPWRP